MSKYDAVLGDLMAAQANGQSVDGGLDALEEMRRDAEQWHEAADCLTREVAALRVDLVNAGKEAAVPVVSPTYCRNCGTVDLKGPAAQQDAAGASDEYAYETATDAEHAAGVAAAEKLVPPVDAYAAGASASWTAEFTGIADDAQLPPHPHECRDAQRINDNGAIAAAEHERAEKAEAALVEAVNLLGIRVDIMQRAAAFVAAHKEASHE